jgi:WD40 repeat protein
MLAVTVADNEIDVVSLETGERITTITDPNVELFYNVRFSPDNSLLYAEDGYYSVYLWRSDDGSLVKTYTDCRDISFSPVSDNVAILIENDTTVYPRLLRIVSISDDRVIGEVTFSELMGFDRIQYSPNGEFILCRFTEDDTSGFKVYRADDLSETASTFVYREIEEFDYTADGEYIVAKVNLRYDQEETARYVFRANNLSVYDLVVGGHISYRSVLPFGNGYVTVTANEGVEFVDINTGKRTKCELPEGMLFWEVIDNGQHIIGQTEDGIVEYDRGTGNTVLVYDKGYDAVASHPARYVLM